MGFSVVFHIINDQVDHYINFRKTINYISFSNDSRYFYVVCDYEIFGY